MTSVYGSNFQFIPGYIESPIETETNNIVPFEQDCNNCEGMISNDISVLSHEVPSILNLDIDTYHQTRNRFESSSCGLHSPQSDIYDDESVVMEIEDLGFLDDETNGQNYIQNTVGFTQTVWSRDIKQELTTSAALPGFHELTFSLRNQNFNDYQLLSQEQDLEHNLGMIEESENVMCRRGKRGAKHVLLWKFLLEKLRDSPDLVRWTDKQRGIFRFVDTIEISRQWGTKKGKGDMTFEKLSRAIRHYYKSGFMSRQEGTRLVYKINWKMVPKALR